MGHYGPATAAASEVTTRLRLDVDDATTIFKKAAALLNGPVPDMLGILERLGDNGNEQADELRRDLALSIGNLSAAATTVADRVTERAVETIPDAGTSPAPTVGL